MQSLGFPPNTASKDILTTKIIPWGLLTIEDKEPLSKDGIATLFKATWWDGADVAIKELSRSNFKLSVYCAFINSIAQYNHPNIIGLYGICIGGSTLLDHMYCNAFVYEFMPGGSLRHLLKNKEQDISWDTRWKMAIEIGNGLSYLHGKNIMSRDLSSDRILLTADGEAKIGDWVIPMEFKAGTAPYIGSSRSPETFSRGYKLASSDDVYSYGMVLWEIASREIPFADVEEKELMGRILNGPKETIPADCPAGFGEVISQAWLKMQERPQIEKLVSDLVKAKPPVSASPPPAVNSPLAKPPLDMSLPGEQNFRTGMVFFMNHQYDEAIFPFKLSARALPHAYPPACLYLYRIYATDVGSIYDELEIQKWGPEVASHVAWFREQLATDQAVAQFHWGLCHEYGLGVPQDLTIASKYYQLAAGQGHVDALSHLERLALKQEMLK